MDPSASQALFREEVDGLRRLAMFNGGGLVIVADTYPDLVLDFPHRTGVRRRFRVRADDWNDLAPSVLPIDSEGNVVSGQPSGGDWGAINNAWGLCLPGTREYHQHHADNPWSNHRASTSLGAIVLKVYASYRRSGG